MKVKINIEKELPDITKLIEAFKKGGKKNWIKGAINPKHKGFCTPMTKSTCTPRRKAFAMTMKKHHGFHKKQGGGLETTFDQYQGGGKTISNPVVPMAPISPAMKTTPQMKLSPEYIEKNKFFENNTGNYNLHNDHLGNPTIGYGHKLTSKELEQNSITLGNQKIPVNQFGTAENAHKLLVERDLPEHYTRLTRQIPKINEYPNQVIDTLFDRVYNRGSLNKQERQFANNMDFEGLRSYYSESANKLTGGLKDRMLWRSQHLSKVLNPYTKAPVVAPRNTTPFYTQPAIQLNNPIKTYKIGKKIWKK